MGKDYVNTDFTAGLFVWGVVSVVTVRDEMRRKSSVAVMHYLAQWLM